MSSFGLLAVGSAPPARAADAKSKAAKKPAGDALGDDKAIGKQLQWEDKVMGPDDKRGEMDKILRAQAINKAATEKAERDKEKAAAREAKEAAAPKAQTSKRGGEVALPTVPDEESTSSRNKSKFDTATADAPPPSPPAKPADDKFIDKLLKEQGTGKKKKASASTDDKALLDLIATDKPAAKAAPKTKGKGRSDGVDSLLLEADKEPATAVPKIKHETPEWQKPEIRSTPVAIPVAEKAPPKRDDGIIHVVQGAAGPAARAGSTTPRVTSTAMVAPTRRGPAGGEGQTGGQAKQPKDDNWSDPFADSPRKTVASRSSRAGTDDDDIASPPARRNASQPAAAGKTGRTASRSSRGDDDSWQDPFEVKKTAAHRSSVPAGKPAKNESPTHGGAWKDPFTETTPAGKPARSQVATRESARASAKRASAKDEAPGKWTTAAKHGSAEASAHVGKAGGGKTQGRWGVLKQRAH